MSIKTTVTESVFINTLLNDDLYGASWTREEAIALYNYYEDLSEDCGEDIELDRVALRCEWESAINIDEVIEVYSEVNSLEDLTDHTQVIELDNGRLLYVAF